MRFTVTIDCDNAAIEDQPMSAIADMLEDQAFKLRYNDDGQTNWVCSLFDLNGNLVGDARFEEHP